MEGAVDIARPPLKIKQPLQSLHSIGSLQMRLLHLGLLNSLLVSGAEFKGNS